MKIIQVGERTLDINDRHVEFDFRIDEFLVLDDRVIILFKTSDFLENDPESGRNVFAFDETGKQLWRIQDSGFTAPRLADDTEVPQPYTGMGPEDDGRIVVFQPIGCEFDLDPDTGKISNMTPMR
jgi:hypothetical protein